jgi:hypothetical protein
MRPSVRNARWHNFAYPGKCRTDGLGEDQRRARVNWIRAFALRDCYLGAAPGFSSFHRPLPRELLLLE